MTIKFLFLIFFILTIPKVISTQNIIAIHFYEMLDSNLGDNEIKNCLSLDKSSEFVNKTPIQFNSDSNIRVPQIFFIDLDIFYLNFLNEEEIQKNQHHNIYINNNIVNYDEFFYFYNIVMNFPNTIDTINEYKYRLIFNILDILKIKTNKKFENFIRLILASLVFNQIKTKEWKVLVPKTKVHSFSSAISKKVIVELLNLYFSSEKTLEKIKDISHAVRFTNDFSFDFIDLNEDYFYFDNGVVQEILKIDKRSMNFLKILDFLFGIHTFYSIFLSNIFYTENFNLFFDLSLFKNLKKVFINRCSNTDILIQKILNVCSPGCIQTLNIICSTFTMNDENLWLKKLDFKTVNCILENNDDLNCFHDSDFNSSVFNIFSRFINEIYNENKSNIFELNCEVPCYDQEKNLSIQFYLKKSKLENFKIIESHLQTYVYTELSTKFLNSVFYNLNFKEFRNIKLYFKNMLIKDFNLPKYGVINNISKIGIYESKFNAISLSKILIFPSLKEVYFKNCIITFLKKVIDFEENSKIEKFNFGTSTVDDEYHFVRFLNHMMGLKILDIFLSDSSKGSNIFMFKRENHIANLANLKSLWYHAIHFSKDMIPVFPIFPRLLVFYFGSNYPKGTLHKIFYNNNFSCLKKLTINNTEIGKEDELAFEKCTSLIYLCFSGYIKCSNINFSSLFNLNTLYSLVELKLPDIEITCLDLEFFSKLKCLKNIYIHRLSPKINIIHFLKSLSSVHMINIKEISIYRNQIYEEFGEKIYKLFFSTYFMNLDM